MKETNDTIKWRDSRCWCCCWCCRHYRNNMTNESLELEFWCSVTWAVMISAWRCGKDTSGEEKCPAELEIIFQNLLPVKIVVSRLLTKLLTTRDKGHHLQSDRLDSCRNCNGIHEGRTPAGSGDKSIWNVFQHNFCLLLLLTCTYWTAFYFLSERCSNNSRKRK